MPETLPSPDQRLSQYQTAFHDQLLHAATPVAVRSWGNAGTLVLLAFTGFLMFGLGASVALFQHGDRLPVFARQAPEDFDRSQLSPRNVRSLVEEREGETLHGANQPVVPVPLPIVEPSLSSSSAESSSLSVPVEPEQEEEPAPLSPPVEEEAPAEESPEEVVPPPVIEPEAPEEEKIEEEVRPIPEEQQELIPAEEPVVRRIPDEIGVFFTQTSVKNEKYLVETLDRLRTLTGSALIFNVKAGTVHFAASAPMAHELDLVRPAYDLPHVIALARERGVRTIGRFVALKDPNLAQAIPETQINHPKTGRSVGSIWVDPSDPSVIEHNKEILVDLVEAGIDEVNFDYIRYPTEYPLSAVGLKGSEKADRIEAFLKMARTVIDEHGGRTKLGISTYAILGWNFPVNFEPLGQDIARFAPLLDVISPMAYPSTFAPGAYYNPAKHPGSRMYYLVYRTLTGYRELLGDQAWKLRPWIQGYGVTQKNLTDEIQAVFDSGSCGFTLWNASNEYRTFLKMLPGIRRPNGCS